MRNFSVEGRKRYFLSLASNHYEVLWAKKNKRILSAIPYTGGKAGLVRLMVPFLEYVTQTYNLRGYIEAFGGGARMLLNIRPDLFYHKVYCELDFPLCCLFYVLGNELLVDELINRLYRQDYDEKVFYEAVAAREMDNQMAEKGRFDIDDSDIVASAANTVIAACFSRAADLKTYDFHSAIDKKTGFYKRVLKMRQFLPILSSVEVIRLNGLRIIEQYINEPDYLIYADPPYVPHTMRSKNHYRYSWSDEDHKNFVDLVKDARAKMVISGYDSVLYDELEENGWKKVFIKEKHVSMSGTSRKAAEFLYFNFDIPFEYEYVYLPEYIA